MKARLVSIDGLIVTTENDAEKIIVQEMGRRERVFEFMIENDGEGNFSMCLFLQKKEVKPCQTNSKPVTSAS